MKVLTAARATHAGFIHNICAGLERAAYLYTYESLKIYRDRAPWVGNFCDYTGDLVGLQTDGTINAKVLSGLLNVPTEDDVKLHPVTVLEHVSTDTRAVALYDCLRKFRAAEGATLGDNVSLPFINIDCGLNLLHAFLVGGGES